MAKHAGQFFLVGLNEQRAEIWRRPVPFRGHEFVFNPQNTGGVIIGRRPSTWALDIDFSLQRRDRLVHAEDGRHFYGHGLFSADGSRLFTSENAYASGIGLVVERDVESMAVVNEWDSGGIGPHEMAWLDDAHLLIANGGLKTHPDKPRIKLNLDSFVSSLVVMHAGSGRILQCLDCPVVGASIRHLALSNMGRAIVGLQYEGPATDRVPLVMTFSAEGGLVEPQASALQWMGLRQYVGSVAISADGQLGVATSPRGHTVAVFDLHNNRLINSCYLPDACGVAYRELTDDFVISSGTGLVVELDRSTLSSARNLQNKAFRYPAVQWDNHLSLV
ncbi:MAG: DUF1513 domain-containing protein [Pseudomonadota bacterium]